MTDETQGAPEGVADDTAAALDTAAETTAAPVADTGEDAAAATDDGEGHAPKPKQTAQERIAELTRARREAERQSERVARDAEYWREQALRNQPAPQAQAAPADAGEPDPNAYEHGELDVRFIRDHATYHAKKAFREEAAQHAQQTRTQTALQTFDQKVAQDYPDGEPDGIQHLRRLPALSSVITEVILDSEIGPKLADHLGQNARELARISALPPIQQARELTKLELKLATPPAPTAKTATDAPAPTPQVRGSSGRFTVAADTNDFAAFEKQFGS